MIMAPILSDFFLPSFSPIAKVSTFQIYSPSALFPGLSIADALTGTNSTSDLIDRDYGGQDGSIGVIEGLVPASRLRETSNDTVVIAALERISREQQNGEGRRQTHIRRKDIAVKADMDRRSG